MSQGWDWEAQVHGSIAPSQQIDFVPSGLGAGLPVRTLTTGDKFYVTAGGSGVVVRRDGTVAEIEFGAEKARAKLRLGTKDDALVPAAGVPREVWIVV